MTLNDIATFLDANGPAFMATRGTCGNPRIRPVQSPLLFDGKIYFCTANTKNLFKHFSAHSGVEFCSCASDGTFMRLRGDATTEQNIAVKKAMFEKYPFLEQLYSSPDNPIFEVFYLANLSARKQSMDGSFEQFKEDCGC